VLAQSKVQDKSNEITAIPALLELLDVKGCIVPDAMGTQKPSRLRFSGRKPTTSCLKANHPTLFQQIDTWFETARAEGTYPYLQNTAEAGIIAPKSVKCGRSHSALPLASGRGMVGTANIVIVERTCHL